MGFTDMRSKFEAFGWEVLEMDGNNIDSVYQGLQSGIDASRKSKPVLILMKTEMGNGVDFMMGSHAWHGIAPNDEQLAQALAQNPETLGDY